MKYTLFLFWTIGKKVYEEQNFCPNSIQKYSDYLSYYYGDSSVFTRENIHFMKRFYLNFPIFYEKLNQITWKQYQLLLMIPNREVRFFYFLLSLFFESNYEETYDFIINCYYERI